MAASDLADMRSKRGTVQLAPRCITDELYVNMRIFSVVSEPAWAAHGKRASLVTTPKLGLVQALIESDEGWQHLLVSVVRQGFYNQEKLEYIGFADAHSAFSDGDLAARVAEFALGFLSARVTSQVLQGDSYPDASVGVLARLPNDAQRCLDRMKKDWQTLLWAETVALADQSMRHILESITWTKHVVPRLAFVLGVSENWTLPACRTMEFLKHVHSPLPDSRLNENLHQHIRDFGRHQRHKGVSRTGRMYACLKSRVLEGARLQAVTVSPQEVRDAPCRTWKEPIKQLFRCDEATPSAWSDIMLPEKVKPSPNPMSLFRGASAWAWLREYEEKELLGLVPLLQGGLTKLLPQHVVVWDQAQEKIPQIVLLTGDYGARTWQLECIDHGGVQCFKLVDTGKPCTWLHIYSLEDWVVVPFEWAFLSEIGIVLWPEDHRLTIAQAAMLHQSPLTKNDLIMLVTELGLPMLAGNCSKAKLVDHVCSNIFDIESPGYHDILQRAQSAPDGIDDKLAKETDMGEALADLVDEIMLQDIDNAADVKSIKQAISAKHRRHLAELQGQARKLALAAKEKKAKPKPGSFARKRKRNVKPRGRADAPPAEAAAIVAAIPAAEPPPGSPLPPPPGSPAAPAVPEVDRPEPEIEGGVAAEDLPAAAAEDLAAAPAAPLPLPLPAAGGPREPPGERLSRTPAVVNGITPPGASVTLDQYALRWKGKLGFFACSKGFYSTGMSRQTSCSFVLDQLWEQSGEARPPAAYIECTDIALWEGTLVDNPDERPQKRARKGVR